MAKKKRQMIKIDEDKCTGCGECIVACPEGALAMVDGKARVVKESFCDGLGACIGECPEGALTIEEKVVDEYDEEGVIKHIKDSNPEMLDKHVAHMKAHGIEIPEHLLHDEKPCCPHAQMMQWEKESTGIASARISSELTQWPVQMNLVPIKAPYFQNADLVLVADCVPIAYANFHQDFLKGNAIAMGCPKFDDAQGYMDKLAAILQNSEVKSLTVVVMEVPCCRGMEMIAREAMKRSGKKIPVKTIVVGIRGETLD
jgi:NAD-dependent dihydropyrimidine dehydrogenase PreA subunit